MKETETRLLKQRLEQVRERIRSAAVACGRSPEEVRLVAVSKTKSAETVARGIAAGITDLGENYIQEAEKKIGTLSDEDVSWHFIGHLQSNKAKLAVRLFDLIHTVDSGKLARELNKQAAAQGFVQKILIQVNIAGEAAKSGVSVEDTVGLITAVSTLKNLSIRGLMTMPPWFDDPEKARPYFSALRRLARDVDSRRIPEVRMTELSMGMSGDFETAVEEGATLVRIGTAIFGERH